MIFCGQCGLQLAPGTTRCPRCGAMIEETNTSATELHPDDATIASHSLTTRNPAGPSQISPPQPLILRPGATSSDYGSQMAYDATNRVEAPNYGTQIPQNPNLGSAYTSSYPDIGTRASGTYGGGGYPTNVQGPYQQPYTQQMTRMRFTSLVLVLLGILLLLIAVVLFVIQRTNTPAGTTPTGTPTAITSTTSNTHSGQQIIQQYYDAINMQNYQEAYNLWKTPPQSFAQFRSGFQHTKHDNVTFGNVTQQSDGTVQVTVTVSATEETQQNGTQQSTYTGYYTTSKQNDNFWKITAAVLEKQ